MIPYRFNPLGISRNKEALSYLTFTAIQDNSSVTLTQVGTANTINLYYKTSSSNVWSPYIIDTEIPLSQGQYVQFWNKNELFSKDLTNYFRFIMTGKIAGSGNVQSLLNFSTNAPTYCFVYLFYNCTSLVTAPELPATTLLTRCYESMFQNCSLVIAPELPTTTLAANCYQDIFNGCTSLVTAPALPATTLFMSCYLGMFQNCTSLVTAPELPATTLASNCYQAMFQGCISLIEAPKLPAIILTANCYRNMFYGCSNLSKVNVSFINWNGLSNATTDWLYGVAASGTFSKPVDLPAEYGASRIPTDWDVANEKGIPLTFTAEEENSSVKMITNGNVTLNNLKYRTDVNGEWQPYTINTVIPLDNVGDYVQFRNNNNTLSISNSDYAQFIMSGKISGSGDIQSLLNYSSITPAYCYRRLFQGCSALTTPPDLTATSIGYYSYASMFNSTGIKTPPIISATSVSNFSCFYMFENCAQLLSAPELLTTTLKDHCYSNMFKNCSSLNYIKVHFTDWKSSIQATDNWVNGVSASGTFIKSPSLTEEHSSSRIPNGWNVASYIEYLACTGTQYIDTGYVFDAVGKGSGLEIKLYLPSGVTGNNVTFGTRQQVDAKNSIYLIGYNLIVGDSDGYSAGSGVTSAEQITVFRFADGKYSVNGGTEVDIRRLPSSQYSFGLFAFNTTGYFPSSILAKSGTRIYYCKFYENRILVHNFIPVLDSNNVPCMYDTVSNTFKYNAGTGTFNYG